MVKLLIMIVALTVSPALFAHDYTCTNAGLERRISVIHAEGQELPCQVKYEKPDEGDTQYPWQAENTAGYCEAKADYLAQRLSSFGWDCTENPESH